MIDITVEGKGWYCCRNKQLH